VSRLRPPLPVKPVAAVFSAERPLLAQAAERLETILGPLDYAGEEFLFDQTEYYRAEMGWPLLKRFFSAEDLIDPAELVNIKIKTMAVEVEFTVEGKRRVNIDPGYISAERLVLATGKNYAHRIYLGQGVWADLTLIFEKGRFRPLPWTYPDYAADLALRTMGDIRKKYLDQLRRGQEDK